MNLKLVSFVVLFGASCIQLCATLNWSAVFKRNSNDANSLTLLNNYLVDRTDSQNFADNIKLLGEFVEQRSDNDRGYYLARALSNLNVNQGDDAICSEANIGSLKLTFEFVARGGNKEANKPVGSIGPNSSELRLTRLLNEYLARIGHTCFDKYEVDWARANKQFGLEYGDKLDILDSINSHHWYLSGAYKGEQTDLQPFDGALQWALWRPNKSKKKSIERHILGWLHSIEARVLMEKRAEEYDAKRRVTDQELTPVKSTTEERRKLLDEYLVKPCESLIAEQALAKPSLESIANLGSLIEITDEIKISSKPYSSLIWASRFVSCDWLLSVYNDKIANKVVQLR